MFMPKKAGDTPAGRRAADELGAANTTSTASEIAIVATLRRAAERFRAVNIRRLAISSLNTPRCS
ncbi:MAG TPA: hypothetical protein VKR21_11815 [Solirubrobacteraceae bacterium]|nr:hypothetical protein [Solirubrobacteraceae bacterium]